MCTGIYMGFLGTNRMHFLMVHTFTLASAPEPLSDSTTGQGTSNVTKQPKQPKKKKK